MSGDWRTEPVWEEPCRVCGEPVKMCPARVEMMVLPYHDGCAGHPYCICNPPHRGACNLREKGEVTR